MSSLPSKRQILDERGPVLDSNNNNNDRNINIIIIIYTIRNLHAGKIWGSDAYSEHNIFGFYNNNIMQKVGLEVLL